MSTGGPNKWDGVIAAILRDKNGDLSSLFHILFSYLQRKTQFFEDFEKTELILKGTSLEYLQKFHAGKADYEARVQAHKSELAQRQKAKSEKQGFKEELKAIMEKIEEKKRKNEEEEKNTSPELKKDKGDLPYKCGGVTEKYIWNQTLVDLVCTIPVDNHLTADDLNVVMNENKLHVSIKGREDTPIIDGEWYERISPADCLWTLESYEGAGKTINLNIQKFPEFQGWWESIVKGEPKIDIGKVNPEENNLEHLDEEIQMEIQKAMFDQRQKQMGLPTIEEMENQKKLEELFKKNPDLRSQLGGGMKGAPGPGGPSGPRPMGPKNKFN